MPVDFCHLHTHSQYSLLDGASRLPDLIRRAFAMGQKALAITDHGNLFGAIEFYKACQEATKAAEKEGRPGLKPILGMEAYIVPGGQPRTTREKVEGEYDRHCLLWAADAGGFKNLMRLSTLAYQEGKYMHPRLDQDLLARYGKGLLGSSGCIGSDVPAAILYQDYAAARRVAGRYMEIFGKGNFYFELQNQCGALDLASCGEDARDLAEKQKKVNEAILKLAKEFDAKVVATNDSHYTTREDAEAHDALLCIGTGKLVTDTNRLKFACPEFYLKSGEEMRALFGDVPEALANTLEVAERCDLKLPFGQYHYPIFPIPDGEEPEKFFRRIVAEGLKARYGDPPRPEVRTRAEEELRVLAKMGFIGYLLIVWDIIREARARAIPVGPGRGSAAGSIVCYALGITNLEPLRYHLLFERFVNEGRNEMPDIDIDFCQSRRGEILEYVQNKYGRDCTAGIITFNSMAAKGSLRDLGRVFAWPLAEVDRIAKLIPNYPGRRVTLQPRNSPEDDGFFAVDDEPELKAAYENDAKARKLIDTARRLEGLARNPGRHAAGLVIADRPISEYAPLYKDKDGALLTQFEMSHMDSVGLLKIDFLGLETLTVLRVALDLIRERHGKDIALDELPTGDAPTYQMLGRGEAKGIFQFESEGMVKLLMEARPDCLEDLIALNAMYRPGPMQNIPAFIGRKHGREPITYAVPELESLLKETYGIIVYQEQVMQIANRLAGFSLSEADSLRKAMGKKKRDLMEKYGKQFVEGCVKNGIARPKAAALYETIAKFAEYGFNKSHAAAYALVAYQTAWLKAHYPAEFMAALLTLKQNNTDDVVLYIEEARRIGLEIAGPDVNRSGARFTIEGPDGRTLRFSLSAIKGVGGKAVESIVAARKEGGAFEDLYGFCERVDLRALNKLALDSLVKAGALDALADEGGRGRLSAALEDAMAHGDNVRRDRDSGQGSLFGGEAEQGARPKLPPVPAWPQEKCLEEEKKVLGFYFSGHPLADVREIIEGLSGQSCKGLASVPDGFELVLGGYVQAVQPKTTRAEGKKMAVLAVEDFTGSVQAVVFPRTYDAYKELLRPDSILFFRGRVKHGDGGTQAASLLVEEVLTLESAVKRYLSGVSLCLRQEDFQPRQTAPEGGFPGGARGEGFAAARLQSVVELLKAHPGASPLWLQVDLDEGPGAPARVSVRAGQRFRVQAHAELFKGLRGIFGHAAVRVLAAGTRAQKPPERRWGPRAAGN
jgi:DNA polymerase-3 subunit alpha